MKRLLLLFALVAVATSAVVALTASASDHIDSPSVIGGDRAADFSDVYAFRNNDNLVVALNVNGVLPPEELANFAADISTEIHVDTNADLADDATVKVTFSTDLLTFKVEGLGDPITGQVTPPGSAEAKVTEANGIKVFAGPRADPFFQDIALFGFLAEPYVPAIGFRRAGDPPVVDYLANFPPSNVSSIVIELPITKLTGAASSSAGTIKVWASTSRGGSQIDRMAIPDNNNFLMPAGQHDAFNHGSPATDAANFRAIAQSSIEAVRARVDPVLGTPQDGGPLGDLTAEQAAAALIPDVLTIDFSQPVQFPNGRRLQDDESDFEVGVLLNRGGAAGMPDGVTYDAITSPPLLTSFPYLAAPFVAAAPTVSGAPNTGTGGPTHGDSSNMLLWLVLAGSLAGIALLGSGFVLRRTSN
jgi:hypothetical protein